VNWRGDSQQSVTCPEARETLGDVLNRVRHEGRHRRRKKLGDVRCLSFDEAMTSLNNIDPSLRDLSCNLSFLSNPITNPATSQDGHHDTDGNSIPGGEPVHCLAFVLSTIHFQPGSHRRQMPCRWTFPWHLQAQNKRIRV
jgi:hypothetical protein